MRGSRLLLFATLAAAVALAGCTGVGGDSDDDGLSKEDEQSGWTVEAQTKDGPVNRSVTSDPKAADTDGDGLNDFEEFRQGTDPRSVDTDEDGLADGPNITSPGQDLIQRLDEAGVLKQDGVWLGEQGFCSEGSLDPRNWDSDSPQVDGEGDGLGDAAEIQGWTAKPQGDSVEVASDPCLRDTDGDNLEDLGERERSTDPRNPDTDGDGTEDRLDADPLWDLHLTVTLDTVELKQDKDTEGGADMRFSVQIGATRDVLYRNVSSTGTHTIDETYAEVDVDDQSPAFGEKAVPLFVSVVDEDPTETEPIAITPDGNQADLSVHLFNETVTRGSNQVGSGGSGSVSGADAALSFTYSTVRT